MAFFSFSFFFSFLFYFYVYIYYCYIVPFTCIFPMATLYYISVMVVNFGLFLRKKLKGAPSYLVIFLATESLSKMMKNTSSYFILKALFVLKILKFLSWIFRHVEINIFLEKSYTKCGGETIPRPFSNKVNIVCISGSIV